MGVPNDVTKTGFRSLLSESSFVSLSLILIILPAVAAGAAWATNISSRLSAIEAAIGLAGRDRWTGTDMSVWVQSLNGRSELWRNLMQREMDRSPQPLNVDVPTLVAPTPTKALDR